MSMVRVSAWTRRYQPVEGLDGSSDEVSRLVHLNPVREHEPRGPCVKLIPLWTPWCIVHEHNWGRWENMEQEIFCQIKTCK